MIDGCSPDQPMARSGTASVGVVSFLTHLMWDFLVGFGLEAIFWISTRARQRTFNRSTLFH